MHFNTTRAVRTFEVGETPGFGILYEAAEHIHLC